MIPRSGCGHCLRPGCHGIAVAVLFAGSCLGVSGLVSHERLLSGGSPALLLAADADSKSGSAAGSQTSAPATGNRSPVTAKTDAPAVPVDAANPQNPAIEVEQLVAQLGRGAAEQARARERLRQLGATSLVHWPQTKEIPIPARAAAEHLRREIRRSVFEQQLGRISIQPIDSTQPQEWLRELVLRSGNRVELSPSLASSPAVLRLPVEAKSPGSFWSGLDHVTQANRLTWEWDRGRSALRLIPLPAENGSRTGTALEQDSFWLTAGPTRWIPADPETSQPARVRIPWQIEAAPRSRLLLLTYAARDVQVRTSNGQTLPPISPAAQFELGTAQGDRLGAQIDMRADEPVTGPLQVSARWKLTIAAFREELRFADLAFGAQVYRVQHGRYSRAAVTLLRAHFQPPAGGTWTARIRLLIQPDPAEPTLESHQQPLLFQRVWLEAKDGTREPLNGPVQIGPAEIDGQPIDGTQADYEFQDLKQSPGGWSLIFELPSLIDQYDLRATWPAVR